MNFEDIRPYNDDEYQQIIKELFEVQPLMDTIHRYLPQYSMPELKVNNLTNIVFEKILDFERLIISLGISLPFGGSLLLVARKTAN